MKKTLAQVCKQKSHKIYMGFDPREAAAYDVARASIIRRATPMMASVIPLRLHELPMLTRPIERKDGRMWCPISQAPMATEFAISRFCVPFIRKEGWAAFVDSDIVCLADVGELFALTDPKFAVMVVKHSQSNPTYRVSHDERCEIINNATNKAEFFVWPVSKRHDQDWVILETIVQGKYFKECNYSFSESASPLPWSCDTDPNRSQIPNAFVIKASAGEIIFEVSGMQSGSTLSALRQIIERGTKMDGQLQTFYARKNWSSVILWNCEHPSNRKFVAGDALNTWPGRDLHAFKWLADDEIGELPKEWNYLVGVNPAPEAEHAKILHYTLGGPWFDGWAGGPCDSVWFAEYCALLRQENPQCPCG